MTGKKILLIALVVNLFFLGIYFSIDSLSAAEEKQAQSAAKKETAQDTRAAWDSLRQREELLRVRQQELIVMEKRIDDKIRRLSELETSVKIQLGAYKQVSDERVKHLVKIYSSMKPNAAANLMNQIDLEVATEVFLNMKGEIAGGILSYMDTQKAAAITKRLMSNRRRTASEPAAPAPSPAQATPASAPAPQPQEQ